MHQNAHFKSSNLDTASSILTLFIFDFGTLSAVRSLIRTFLLIFEVVKLRVRNKFSKNEISYLELIVWLADVFSSISILT